MRWIAARSFACLWAIAASSTVLASCGGPATPMLTPPAAPRESPPVAPVASPSPPADCRLWSVPEFSQATGPAVTVERDGGEGVQVPVEVVRTDPDRERGLMHRRTLAPYQGMLFVFERMEHQSFWMKDTHIPLDIVFIDDRLRVVGIAENAEPRTLDAREVEGESQYVLEVNAGFARCHGVRPGTRVTFREIPLIAAM